MNHILVEFLISSKSRETENIGDGRKLSILGFRGALHGRTIGSLSVTCMPSRVKTDTPVLDFPLADFPNTKYPLDQFETENQIENARVLTQIRNIIQTRRREDRPVTGIIIEPILAEGQS